MKYVKDSYLISRDYKNFSEFVDFENRACSFNTDKFIGLIKDAKAATNPIRIEENMLNMTLSGDFEQWEMEENALQYLFFGNHTTRYLYFYPSDGNQLSHFIPVVNEIVAAIEGYNNMPMETPNYTFGDSLSEIVNATMYSFYMGVLTAEQAASELQNKISLYLME